MAYYQPTSDPGGTYGSTYQLPYYALPNAPNTNTGIIAPGVTGLSPNASTSPQGVTYMTMDPNAMVSNQITGLLSDDSKYLQDARARGVAYGASRGLLNSDMSGGASENSAIAAALPIAQGNASYVAGVNSQNAAAANQFTGENIAANAQIQAASAQVSAASIMAQEKAQEAKQQFQEYGMGLGLNYAQLGENDKQFLMSFGQHGAEFQAQLDQNNEQFEKGLAQDMAKFNAGIGLDMTQLNWDQYKFGVMQNAQNAHDYSTAFMNFMIDPNMTPEQRTNAIASAKDFYGQLSQWTMAGTAFVPPYASNPNWWSTDWTGGSQPH